ncbi:MAG: hypothetical protein J6R22_03860 [Alphaproteobacteria bacterium]|nr:hypothetical protein [Alphaproteobacteria bacterium]
MKKTLTTILFSVLTISAVHADLPWWHQDTVCRLNTTKCYTTMGTGFDTELWDSDSNCRGMKIVCGNALKQASDENTPVSKYDLASSNTINSDFDTNLLARDGDCFGRRKTTKNGTMAIVDGKPVKVYCSGLLDSDNIAETIETGDIAIKTPACGNLSQNGYIAVLNDDCYGKYFDFSEYVIECSTGELPSRMIVLNGADYSDKIDSKIPQTQDAADDIFDEMYSISKEQVKKYFVD